MRVAVFRVFLCLAPCAPLLGAQWFEVSLGGYAPGDALSQQGAEGGAWLSGSPSATNVFDGVRNGMEIAGGGEVVFAPNAPPAGLGMERFDFSLRPEALAPFSSYEFDGAAGLVPALVDDDAPGYYGFTARGWVALTAEGAAPAAGEWMYGRIELKRMADDVRLVRYLVKRGAEWVRLADAAGCEWFRAKGASAPVGTVSFTGKGRFSDFSGVEAEGEQLRLFRWTGGADGDWNEASNWTVDGAAADVPPGAEGDIALVEGEAALTRAGESATAHDLMVAFGEEGSVRHMGGDVITSVELDVSRPRVGKALEAKCATFLGISPEHVYEWRRGSTAKVYEAGLLGNMASYTPVRGDYEHWIKFRARSGGATLLEKEFFFSKLPVMYLATDDGATPSKNKETHDGTLMAQGNDEWKSPYDGRMTIKVRGNTTASYPKKPWKIKLDKKTKMFDIPKSKHWVLLANYNDQSMMRNKLAYDFARDIGSTGMGMKSTWVECVLNGAWQGTYQFCEHIRIEKDRIDIHDWEGDAGDLAEAFAAANGLTKDQEDALSAQLEQNLAWITSDSFTFYDATNKVTLAGRPSDFLGAGFADDISGGYLLEFSNEYDETSKFTTSSGSLAIKTMLKNPEFLRTNSEMFGWCQTFLKSYWDACTSPDGYSAEGKPVCEYCDYDSMVNYWLTMELFGNNDAVYKSRYAYKDRSGKLKWGPVWDFDWGVASVRVTTNAEEWKCQDRGVPQQAFYKEWSDNPEFCTRLFTRYWQVLDRFAACFEQGGLIDQYTNYLNEACRANSAKWDPVHDKKYNLGAASFAADVSRLRSYLERRLVWLDAQFASVPALMASLKVSTATHPYTPDAAALPIAFDGLNSNGTVYSGRTLRARFACGNSAVASISCYVNGIRVAERVPVVGGEFSAVIPPNALTAAEGEPNCVSFVAYDASGAVVTRNYSLVSKVSPATVLLLR